MKSLISIVVAAYNESSVIESNVRAIMNTLAERENITSEVIIVDDGSSDNSLQILKGLQENHSGKLKVFSHWRNYGQGRAIRTGVEQASGDAIITLDADLSYGPEYIWLLYDKLVSEKVEIVLASPYTKGGIVENVPYYRYFLSKWGNRYLSLMSSYKVSTITCVVRAYRKEVFDELYLSSDGMEMQLEILMKAFNANFRISEIPAKLEWRKEKKAEASITRISKMRILRAIRLYLYFGWLSKPSMLFVILSLLFLVPGVYMYAWLIFRFCAAFFMNLAEKGITTGVSFALQSIFQQYSYTFAFGFAFIIIGIQMLIFSLISLQSKYYFDEIYKVNQRIVNFKEKSKN